MIEPHKIWVQQCEAALDIKQRYGIEKALGYLIGEKLLNFVREAGKDSTWATELPGFILEIKKVFTQDEITGYFETLKRVGALGHVATEEDAEFMEDAGVFGQDPVQGAEEVLLVMRIKVMLSEESA